MFVKFLQDHLRWKLDERVDLRESYVDTLVRQGIAVRDEVDASGSSTFFVSANEPTAGDISSNYVLQADGDWVENTGGGHTGTTGSIFFAGPGGAGSAPTEDNDKLFWDDTSDELGINVGTSPDATLHVGRDLSTGDIVHVVRTGEVAARHSLYVGDGSATPDFAVWGDGRCAIGSSQATTNAFLRVVNPSGFTTNAAAVSIQQEDTGTTSALIISCAATTIDAVTIDADNTTADGFTVDCDDLTSGSAMVVQSNSSSVVARNVVEFTNSNVAADNADVLYIRQAADAYCLRMVNVSSAFLFGIWYTGDVLVGTETVPSANGGKVLTFGDNAADPTMGNNTAGIYAKDVAGTVHMFAVDEADNATQISPHDKETGEWIFFSRNVRTGREVRVDMERFFREQFPDYLQETGV